MSTLAIPRAFVWRRLHSLMGLWLVLFLMEHLLANSQAALWLGDHGQGFVNMVNGIHNLPYLQVIEVTLLGIPILIHGILGMKYLLTSKLNFHRTDGSAPAIRTGRNLAYSWQRITSWVLLIGLILHVVNFRFLHYPDQVQVDNQDGYTTVISNDDGLESLACRLNVILYDQDDLPPYLGTHYRLESNEKVALTKDFGTASLLGVRNEFKNPIYASLYTLFVLAACFHAFNGFWTFLITWGWILKASAQRAWISVAMLLMLGIVFLGLSAIWGSYWIK